MAEITITLTDTPNGGIAIRTNFKPAIGAPCSNAQAAALDILRRTGREWGLSAPPLNEVDISVSDIKRLKAETVTKLKALSPMSERGR